MVVADFVVELELAAQTRVMTGHDLDRFFLISLTTTQDKYLVEDVVATLSGCLSDDTGLLEQVYDHIPYHSYISLIYSYSARYHHQPAFLPWRSGYE